MCIAASFGHDAVVKVLAQRAEVDGNSMSIAGRSPLFCSAAYGYEQVVATLIEAGTDPSPVDENGDTALIVARRYGHRKIVEMLEQAGENSLA